MPLYYGNRQILRVYKNNQEILKVNRNNAEVFAAPATFAGPNPDSLPVGIRGVRLVSNGSTYSDRWAKTTSIAAVVGRLEGSLASDVTLAAAAAGRPMSIHIRYERTTTGSTDETFLQTAGVAAAGITIRTGSTTGLVVFSGFTRTFPVGTLPVAMTGQHVIQTTLTSTETTAKVDGVASTNLANSSTNTVGTTFTVGTRIDRTLSLKGPVLEMIILYGATAAQDLEVHDYLRAVVAGSASSALPAPPATPVLYQSYYDNDQLPRATFTQQVQNVEQAYCTQIATNRTSLERFEVRVGDVWHGLTTERSELSGPTLDYDQDIWISFHFKILPGTEYTAWNVAGQVHGTAGTSPLLAHELENGNYIIKTRHDRAGYVTTTRHSFAYARNVEYKIVHHLRLSRLGDGRLETWIDGAKVIDVTAPIGYNLVGSPYWKHGLYRSGTATQTIAVEWANVEVQMGGTLLGRVTAPLSDPRL